MVVVTKLGDDLDDNKSLSDLMAEAFGLSLDVAFCTITPDGHYFDTRDTGIPSEHEDMVWCWADGLMSRYVEKRMTGQCSLQDMIDFDPAEFEQEVRNDIATMQAILATVGQPKRLTNDELVARGYKPRKVVTCSGS